MFIRNPHEGPITEQGVLRDVAIPATLDFCQKNRALSDCRSRCTGIPAYRRIHWSYAFCNFRLVIGGPYKLLGKSIQQYRELNTIDWTLHFTIRPTPITVPCILCARLRSPDFDISFYPQMLHSQYMSLGYDLICLLTKCRLRDPGSCTFSRSGRGCTWSSDWVEDLLFSDQ
jgi:hypothetical protein